MVLGVNPVSRINACPQSAIFVIPRTIKNTAIKNSIFEIPGIMIRFTLGCIIFQDMLLRACKSMSYEIYKIAFLIRLANFTGSMLAPPGNTPSTAGWAINDATFSDVTLPP